VSAEYRLASAVVLEPFAMETTIAGASQPLKLYGVVARGNSPSRENDFFADRAFLPPANVSTTT
jgi:hypothetical protein